MLIRPVAQESIELVQSAFAAWNRREVAAFALLTSPDVTWLEVSGRPEGDGAELHGRERMRRSLESLFEAWETYRIEVERLETVDDRVLAVVREIAKGRASGVEVDGRWGYLITVEGGQITRVEAYRDPALALEAAGVVSAPE
jgi:ketosteroid isomerase-like protein